MTGEGPLVTNIVTILVSEKPVLFNLGDIDDTITPCNIESIAELNTKYKPQHIQKG